MHRLGEPALEATTDLLAEGTPQLWSSERAAHTDVAVPTVPSPTRT